jgi:hypothetical protein
MDPVDKTFDAVYAWSQKVSHVASKSARYVQDQAQNAANGVSNSANGLYSYISPTTATVKVSTPVKSGSWFTAGLSQLTDTQRIAASSLVLALGGLTGLYYLTARKSKIRRRANRLHNGARKDVVLIVGSVIDPLTRFIAHDLETRGFIVYVTSTNSKADLKFFSNESIQDIKSLIVSSDFKNNEFNAEQLAKFDYLLSSEHIPFQGASPNKLELVGILFVPDSYYPSGKFHTVPPTTWDNNVESKMLLPLNLLNNGLIGIAEKYGTNIIFITTTLSLNLHLPYHSVENITSAYLTSLCQNLALDYEDLNITNLKLGSIAISSNNNRKTFGIKGSALRKLHHKIFDLIYSDHNDSVEYSGIGSRFLNYFGRWIPLLLVRFQQFISGSNNDDYA